MGVLPDVACTDATNAAASEPVSPICDASRRTPRRRSPARRRSSRSLRSAARASLRRLDGSQPMMPATTPTLSPTTTSAAGRGGSTTRSPAANAAPLNSATARVCTATPAARVRSTASRASPVVIPAVHRYDVLTSVLPSPRSDRRDANVDANWLTAVRPTASGRPEATIRASAAKRNRAEPASAPAATHRQRMRSSTAATPGPPAAAMSR